MENELAKLCIDLITDGSRIGDLLIHTDRPNPTIDDIPSFVTIRCPNVGGGQYPDTYGALIKLQTLITRGELPKHRRGLVSQCDSGKAIIVDSDGEHRIFIVTAESNTWFLQTLDIFSGYGVAIEFRKAELSPDENKALALLLAAMQNEQAIAKKTFDKVLYDNRDLQEAATEDSEAAEIWQRFSSFNVELDALVSRKR